MSHESVRDLDSMSGVVLILADTDVVITPFPERNVPVGDMAVVVDAVLRHGDANSPDLDWASADAVSIDDIAIALSGYVRVGPILV